MTDDHGRPAQGVQAGDRIVDVAVQVERLEVGGVRPEVRPQIEGVPLPAALCEVLEVPLPDPGATQLTVEQIQRSATGPALRQPALDVQAAILDDDLVLAHGPAGQPGCGALQGVDAAPRAGLALVYHSSGPNTRPVGALGSKKVDF